MTNKQKAEEISQCHKSFYYLDDGTCTTSALECYHSAMDMAEWKEKQLIEKACKCLENTLSWVMPPIPFPKVRPSKSKLIEEFRKTLEKGEI